MSPLKPAIVLVAASLSAMSADSRATSADPAPPNCTPRLVSAPTLFPVEPRNARRGGTVALGVKVDRDGSVEHAEVIESSGLRALDRSAVDSALSSWKFAASACADSRVPQAYIVVEFETRAAHTFSATRMPGYRTELRNAAARGCEVSTFSEGDFVMSCVTTPDTDERIAGR